MALSREDLLDMFCQALDIKEKKKKLYEEAMQGCSDQVGRETFGLLMNAEMEHIRYLQEMYEDLKKGSDWSNACRYIPAEEQALKALYKRIEVVQPDLAEACSDEVMALDTGVQLEEACIRLFEEKWKASEDPEQKTFFERLAAEDREHRAVLEDLKYYYSDPQGWYMEKSGARLDGAGPFA